MSDKTKAVNLTEDEIIYLIGQAGHKLNYPMSNVENIIERINYLNKRLKAFKEPEITADTDALNPDNQKVIKSDNSAAGWGPENG